MEMPCPTQPDDPLARTLFQTPSSPLSSCLGTWARAALESVVGAGKEDEEKDDDMAVEEGIVVDTVEVEEPAEVELGLEAFEH